MQPAIEIKAPPRKISLPATYLGLAQYVTQTYFTLIPLGHAPDDLLRPEYWMHAAKKLRPNYFIRVRAEDGSFDGELLVIQASDTWAKCVWFILNERGDGERAAADYSPQRENYKLEPNARGWRVIEKASGKVIAKDLPQKADAEKALDVYLQDMKTN
jgi:hypothetical protein